MDPFLFGGMIKILTDDVLHGLYLDLPRVMMLRPEVEGNGGLRWRRIQTLEDVTANPLSVTWTTSSVRNAADEYIDALALIQTPRSGIGRKMAMKFISREGTLQSLYTKYNASTSTFSAAQSEGKKAKSVQKVLAMWSSIQRTKVSPPAPPSFHTKKEECLATDRLVKSSEETHQSHRSRAAC